VCTASIATLKEALRYFQLILRLQFEFFLRLFGAKAIPIKPIMAAFISFFENADKGARTEAFNLAVELYRWLGVAIKSQVDTLRAAQVIFSVFFCNQHR
jgi:hypothetical protein